MMGRAATAQPATTKAVDTLGAIHLAVERQHDRASVLTRSDGKGGWYSTPDWRLHRHIVRIALYLRERTGMRPGHAVALVGPITPEWVVVDWATVTQGATVVVLGAEPTDAALDLAWSRFAPRAVFVAGEEARRRILARGGESTVVAFEDEAPDGTATFRQVLDLGGTLDTAERAGAFRDLARAIDPGSDAVAHVVSVADGAPRREVLTHADVIAKRQGILAKHPSARGAVAYVRPDALSIDAHVALYAFVGDGATSTVIGTAGRELEEIARLGPGMVVTRSGVVAADGKRSTNGAGGLRGLLERKLGGGFGGSR